MCWIVALHASPTANSIGADWAKAFAEALKVNSTLTQLNVRSMFSSVAQRVGAGAHPSAP